VNKVYSVRLVNVICGCALCIVHKQRLGALKVMKHPCICHIGKLWVSPRGAASIRMEVVARVASLVRLNGSTITPVERRDAELRYLRRVQHAQANSYQDVVERRHPRLQCLLEQYGNLTMDGVEGGDGCAPVSLGEEMLNVTLRCVSSFSIDKVSTWTVTLFLKIVHCDFFPVKLDDALITLSWGWKFHR